MQHAEIIILPMILNTVICTLSVFKLELKRNKKNSNSMHTREFVTILFHRFDKQTKKDFLVYSAILSKGPKLTMPLLQYKQSI